MVLPLMRNDTGEVSEIMSRTSAGDVFGTTHVYLYSFIV